LRDCRHAGEGRAMSGCCPAPGRSAVFPLRVQWRSPGRGRGHHGRCMVLSVRRDRA
jgi:hypothetical protein